jgi:hypothetical protein
LRISSRGLIRKEALAFVQCVIRNVYDPAYLR